MKALSFTLDTNCLIDLDEDRPNAAYVRQLIAAHPDRANVAYVAISASEKQKQGGQLELFGQFTDRLKRLGIAHLHEAMPLLYFDVGYMDHALWAGPDEIDLDRRIHELLFPDLPQDWPDFVKAQGLTEDSRPYGTKWHNAKCDVQALWSHINEGRDVFVTSDTNFLGAKREPLIALGARRILTPREAADLL